MKIEKYYFGLEKNQVIKTGIYKIEHSSVPNIYYVGSTFIMNKGLNQGFYLRWRLHKYYLLKGKHHSYKLQDVVNKLGIDGLKFSIIEVIDNNIEHLVEREQYWINTLNSYKNGYNVLPFARTSKGRINTNKNLGKRINQFDINGNIINEFLSARDANKKTGVSYKKISLVCNGINHSAGGYIWRFINDKFDKYIIKIHTKNFKIYQYTLDNKYIREWDSPSLAVDEIKVSFGNLSSCLNNKRKTAGGFIWKREIIREIEEENDTKKKF